MYFETRVKRERKTEQNHSKYLQFLISNIPIPQFPSRSGFQTKEEKRCIIIWLLKGEKKVIPRVTENKPIYDNKEFPNHPRKRVEKSNVFASFAPIPFRGNIYIYKR